MNAFARTIRRSCAIVALAGCGTAPVGASTSPAPADSGASSNAQNPAGDDAGSSTGAEADAGDPRSLPEAGQGVHGTDAGAAAARPDATVVDAGDGATPTPVECAAGSSLAPGDANGSLDVAGTTRSYILHVPSNLPAKAPVPLVLDFHPILATDSFEESNSGYKALADQEGFVVAFPSGIDNAWNIGPCCTTSRTVDDLGFAKALVAKIETQGCIDAKRVYAVGYSMGGGLSHYLACNAADVFAAVAPAAFDLLEESEEPCHPSRPITEISFRGTADPIVPYDGGASNPPNGLQVTIHFLGAQGTFQKWAQLDQCSGAPSAPDTNGCSTYSQCAAGVEVTLCTKQGGGHDTGNPQIGWAMLKAHRM